MRKARDKVPAPIIRQQGVETPLSLAEAAALIASRNHNPGESERSARDRARQRLAYWVSNGELTKVSPNHFRLGQLGYLLRSTWPDKFADIPAEFRAIGRASGGALAKGAGLTLGVDLESCHNLIRGLTLDKARSEEELRVATARLEELEPLAKAKSELGKKLKSSGIQGGRGNKK